MINVVPAYLLVSFAVFVIQRVALFFVCVFASDHGIVFRTGRRAQHWWVGVPAAGDWNFRETAPGEGHEGPPGKLCWRHHICSILRQGCCCFVFFKLKNLTVGYWVFATQTRFTHPKCFICSCSARCIKFGPDPPFSRVKSLAVVNCN